MRQFLRWNGSILAVLLSLAGLTSGTAWADCYRTKTAAGMENSAVTRFNSLSLAAVCNYDTTNPKMAMIFDAAALPANTTAPDYFGPLAPATSANLPTCASFAIPKTGVIVANAVVIACSTTGSLLNSTE